MAITQRKTIAVFDFDGTITRHDSFARFVKATSGTPRFYRGIFLQMPRLVAYKLGILSNSRAKEALFGTYFRGMTATRFAEAGTRFIPEIERMLRDDTMQSLIRHRDAGHTIYIVSASMPQWIEPWARNYGIAKVIGTEPETGADGRLTGRFSTPNCYGAEKVKRFLDVEPDRASYRLVVYGDSRGDREMLAEADEANLVV